MSQTRKMLTLGFNFQNGKLITPLLLFYLQLSLVCTKTHRFAENTPRGFFNGFVQSAVDAMPDDKGTRILIQGSLQRL